MKTLLLTKLPSSDKKDFKVLVSALSFRKRQEADAESEAGGKKEKPKKKGKDGPVC